MIKIKFENGKCLIKDSIDLGNLGKYENLELLVSDKTF